MNQQNATDEDGTTGQRGTSRRAVLAAGTGAALTAATVVGAGASPASAAPAAGGSRGGTRIPVAPGVEVNGRPCRVRRRGGQVPRGTAQVHRLTPHAVAESPRWPAHPLWIVTAAIWVASVLWYGRDVVRGGRLRTEVKDPVFAPFTALIVIVPIRRLIAGTYLPTAETTPPLTAVSGATTSA